MASVAVQFYRQQGAKLIQSCLQSVVGKTSEYVSTEEVFRKQVVDRGWDAIPDAMRTGTRQELLWDEVLLALRLRVYSQKNDRLVLVPDAPALITATLSRLLNVSEAALKKKGVLKPPPGLARDIDENAAAQGGPRKTAPTPERTGAPALALGIDLGTTYSVIAYLDPQGRPTSIHNQTGDLLTASVVLFDPAGIVVGKEAVQAGSMQPDQIADCAKRHMGARAYPKKINDYEYPPEVISAFVLRSLKADAENKLGPVTQAVITVPAYFDEARRRATLDAGRLADLEVLDILNEPTAAALAYGYQLGFMDWRGQLQRDRPLRVLVYDLGGGTFDVTVVHIEETSFRTLATDGDAVLGGKDWDEKLVELVADRVLQQSGADPRQDAATMWEIWTGCEAAKRTLSERPKAAVFVNLHGKRHKVEVTREEFEQATAALLERTKQMTTGVVTQSKITWDELDKVLLVGGSTRMPMVPQMLSNLTGKTPERSVSPDEAVAHGAALYADLLLQRRRGGSGLFSVSNVSAHSLGIIVMDPKTNQRCNQVLIPKNSPLPTSVTKTFKTWKPNQRRITIRVVEGDSERPEMCSKVGMCKIDNLPENLPAGTHVKVRYAYEENGRLEVKAKLSGQSAVVNNYLLRENKLADAQLEEWEDWVRNEWLRRGS